MVYLPGPDSTEHYNNNYGDRKEYKLQVKPIDIVIRCLNSAKVPMSIMLADWKAQPVKVDSWKYKTYEYSFPFEKSLSL